ncbi:hypothetical protein AB4Z21_37690, partial [Paenibacillus sp. MCAF20]
MKGYRKSFAVIMSIILCISMFTACSNGSNKPSQSSDESSTQPSESASPSSNEESPSAHPEPQP